MPNRSHKRVIEKYRHCVVPGRRVFKELSREFGSETIFLICPWPGTGDAFIVGQVIKAYLHNHRISNYTVLISSKSAAAVLEELYEESHVHVLPQESIDNLIELDTFCNLDRVNYLHFNTRQHTSIAETVEGINDIDFLEMYQSFLLDEFNDRSLDQPRYAANSEIEGFFTRNHLKPGRTVIIAPFTSSLDIRWQFWNRIIRRLRRSGYDVCLNASPKELPKGVDVTCCQFDFDSMISVLEYAGCFLSIRSGLCDVVHSAECKMAVVYPAFSSWGDSRATAKEYLSLRKLWNCGDVFEVEYEEHRENELIESIYDYFDDNKEDCLHTIKPEATYVPGLISVIVPAYNVEKHVGPCLQSLLDQTYSNLEILAIDNGSLDGTRSVIAEVADCDMRVRQINIEVNKGVSNARNIGLDAAKGEYVTFCDSDDYVPPNAYQQMINRAKDCRSDVVVGGWIDDEQDGALERHIDVRRGKVIPFFAGGGIWNKLYKHDLLEIPKKIRFRCDVNFGEDTLFLGRFLQNRPDISILSNCVYCHIDRPSESAVNQLTHHYNKSSLEEYVRAGIELYSMDFNCSDREIFSEYSRYISYLDYFWDNIENAKEHEESFDVVKKIIARGNWSQGSNEETFENIFGVDHKTFLRMDYQSYLVLKHVNQTQRNITTDINGIKQLQRKILSKVLSKK